MTAVAHILPVHLTFEFTVDVEIPFVADLDALSNSDEKLNALADSIRSLIQVGVMKAFAAAHERLSTNFQAELALATHGGLH